MRAKGIATTHSRSGIDKPPDPVEKCCTAEAIQQAQDCKLQSCHAHTVRSLVMPARPQISIHELGNQNQAGRSVYGAKNLDGAVLVVLAGPGIGQHSRLL